MDLVAIFQCFAAAVWNTLCEMAPYLLFGFFAAGVLSAFISPEAVERHLGGHGFGPTLKAALFGVPLPLCSCGVIPVAAALRKHGASRGATTAFILSTPQTGVDSILVTYSLLGPLLAIIRPVAAFVTGLVGGYLVEFFGGETATDKPLGQARCTDECCEPGLRRGRLAHIFHYGFVTLPRDMATPLLVGLLVAGAIAAFVPENLFAGYLGTGITGMLVMLAVGIPLYVCATGSVPVAAALIAKGVSPGAVLVFLMTGPATNAAAIAVVLKLLGRRAVALYLLALAGCALAAGMLLDYAFSAASMTAQLHHAHAALPGWFKVASAIVLLGLLGCSYFRPVRKVVHGPPATL